MRNLSHAALLAASFLLCTSTGLARSHHVIALAPVELVAAGFSDLAGLVVDGAGNVLVADRRAGTVTRIAPDQRRTVVASRLDRPAGLALDDAGRLLIAEEGAGRVVRLEAGGRRTTIIAGLESPRWVVADDVGTVYVSARRLSRDARHDVDEEDADPDVILAWSSARGLRVFTDDFRRLEGLALGDGVVYAAARGRRPEPPGDGVFYRIDIRPDGSAGVPTPLAVLERFQRPLGIARDRLGALYTSARRVRPPHQRGDDLVVKLAPDAARTIFANGLEDPHGLGFDTAGHLYVADGDTGRVLRFRAPAAPVLDAAPEFTRSSTVPISGRADRHARITVVSADGEVAAPTDAAGRFSVNVALAPDARTAFDVFVTPFRGQGLTSPAAEMAITHDGTAPSIAFIAPGAGAFVRGIVSVQAQASDGGSGLGMLNVARGTQPLGATITPPLPAPTATATSAWDTAALPDGTQALSVTAIDRAGNTMTADRQLIVDNTPPETSIVGGPTGAAESSVVFTVAGTDNLSTPAALHFSWRLDDGAWSPFTGATSIALSGVGQGAHRFEVRARDQAGNEDATPAVRDFTVGGVRVTITSPVAGATVPAGLVLVRGTVEGLGGEIGVAVNDVAAAVSGPEFAGALLVDAGPTILTIVATGAGGASAEASVPITAVGMAAREGLSASPVNGVAPLTVAFSVSGVADGARVDLDADGNGSIDITGDRLEGQPYTFTSPGLYVASATITDPSGARTTVQTVVQVFDRVTLDAALQAKWSAMKAALRAGDIPAALEFIVDRRRADYGQAFAILVPRLPAIDAIMTDVALVWVRNAAALYEMVRVDAGITKSFEIRFALGGDGVWRLESF